LAALLLATFGVAILAASALAASGNLVKNSSFEKDSNGDGLPNGWEDFSDGTDPKRVCNQAYAGSCSLKMVGGALHEETTQFVDVSGLTGDSFTLTIWTKGKNVATGGKGYVEVYLVIYNTGGGNDFDVFDVPTGNSAWTKHTISVTATAAYDFLAVSIASGDASGKAWFDKVKLVQDP
jgi:hypothetical protein